MMKAQKKELAFNLYQAGFPFNFKKEGNLTQIAQEEGGIVIDGKLVVLPSLSELIEACVKNPSVEHFILEHDYDWSAYSDDNPLTIQQSASYEGSGSTPEEAVALLYLKLHERKT